MFFLLAGTGLAGTFLLWATRHSEESIIDLRLFAGRPFATAAVTQFLANGTVLGGQLLLSLYLIDVTGADPARAGWLLGAVGLGALVSYPAMSGLIRRFGARSVTLGGGAIGLASTLPMLLAKAPGPGNLVVLTCLVLRGLSIGAVTVPSVALAYRSVPVTAMTQATTALNIVQRLGGPVATTMLTLALTAATPFPRSTGEPLSFAGAFAILALLYMLVSAAALCLPRRDRRQT